MARTSGWATRAAPASSPVPCTRLTTPGGTPAASTSSISRWAQSGESSAAFITTQLPARSAGHSFHVGMAIGKFQGVIRPTTPTGLRSSIGRPERAATHLPPMKFTGARLRITRVVVVGAGFGGLAATHALARMPVEIVVVDAQNHHTFQPLLYQVATAALNAADIAQSVRGMFHDRDNVDFRLGRVCGLDADRRLVELEGQPPLAYDYLVLAAGATTGYFGIPGVEEHALPLKSLSDALTLRNHLLLQFERAASDLSLVDEGALTVVIVGGGPTGVELAGAIAELRDHVLAKDFPDLDVSRSRIVLLEATDRLLGTFHPRSAMGALH